jgi:hypothetical protein
MQLSLPPGSYILSAAVNAPAARGAPSQPSRFAGYVALEANPYGPPQTVTVSVNPVLGVAGRIALDGGGATATDLARLSIQFRRTTRIPNIPNPTAVSPDAEGSFSALGFIDGEYLIEVAGFQGSLADAYVKSIRFAGVETADTGARIADQPAAALEISLARGASQLDGAATSGDGAVAADATIVLVPDRRNRRDLYKATISDASGRFHLDGVAPGAYRLFAWEEDLAFGSWFAAEFLRSVEDRGTPVVVGEGVRQNVEARVIPIR